MVDSYRLLAAFQTARRELLALREPAGQWVGELSSSVAATATATSALCIVAQGENDKSRREAYQQLACRSADWLVAGQNTDGGWGNTREIRSTVGATMLARAAIELASQTTVATAGAAAATSSAASAATHEPQAVPNAPSGSKNSHPYLDSLARSKKWLDDHGGMAELRRQYCNDPTMLAAILGNSALAGQAAWRDVPAMAFEIAWLPQSLRNMLGSAPGYADPVRVGIGQAQFFHRWPRNPLVLLARCLSVGRSLRVLARRQPPSGGFLESVPWTSFLVMGLASTGRGEHPVARRGLGFLLDTVLGNASWWIDTSLVVSNTALAVSALASASGDVGALDCLDWLLRCQKTASEPFSEPPSGGWGCNDDRGSPADVGSTSAVLLALSVLMKSGAEAHRPRIETAAATGIDWLLAQQNDDGGWPTFRHSPRGASLHGSGADMTAHALRALWAWQQAIAGRTHDEAIARGMRYLAEQQQSDGRWRPLWFGNPNWPDEENPVYGVSQVILAFRDAGQIESPAAQRGLEWLASAVDPGGGWGGGQGPQRGPSSVEETAMAVEALLAAPGDRPGAVLEAGLEWLIRAVEESRHRQAATIGLRPGRLWYSEKVFPLAFTVSALGQAVKLLPRSA